MAENIVAEPEYVAQLSEALKQELPGAELHSENVRTDRYRIIVFWPPFDEMEHPDRQRIVWNIAERVLSKDDIWKITMIQTLGNEDLPSE